MRVCPSCRALYLNNEPFCSKDGRATEAMEDQQNRSLVGTQIGNYQVTALLGEGGMGKVYRAEHPSLGRVVAIKVLHEEYAKKINAVERFFLEAKTVNQIGHENIVDVLDFGSLSDGSPYYVMAYLEGQSLSALVKRQGALPLADVQAIILPVLSALQAAHEEGIIHRDLKPDNIFLAHRKRGPRQVKLLDFGIAKLLDSTATQFKTSTGAVIGTPAYMAPEQIQSLPNIDGRVDVYAAGVLLYQMLTGHLPFTGHSAIDVLQKHVLSPVPSPKALRSDLPQVLDTLTQRALAKEPSDRFPSARDFAAQLEEAFFSCGLPPLVAQLTPPSLINIPALQLPPSTVREEPTHSEDAAPKLSRTTLTASTGELTPPGERPASFQQSPRWVLPAVGGALGAVLALYFFAFRTPAPAVHTPTLPPLATVQPAPVSQPVSQPSPEPTTEPASPAEVPSEPPPANQAGTSANKTAKGSDERPPRNEKPPKSGGLDKLTPKIRNLKK